MLLLYTYFGIFIASVITYLIARKLVKNNQIKGLSALAMVLIPSLYLIANQLQNIYLTFNFQIFIDIVWIFIFIIYVLVLIFTSSGKINARIFWQRFFIASLILLTLETIGLALYIFVF
jgi:hypothetical protein